MDRPVSRDPTLSFRAPLPALRVVAVLVLSVGMGVLGAGCGRSVPATAGIGASGPGADAPTAGPCPVTVPDPAFAAPSPAPAQPPARYGAAWYGDARLWTMLAHDGERWDDLGPGPDGYGQKTFWWSADWSPTDEPMPDIVVSGERLDGPGSFRTTGPGTNASADFGTAMLVGIDIPTAGCWRLTGRYNGAELSYVAVVGEP